MIVRVGLGISTDDVEVSLATIRDAENEREMTGLGLGPRAVRENAVLNIMVAEEGGPDGVWVRDAGAYKSCIRAEVTCIA